MNKLLIISSYNHQQNRMFNLPWFKEVKIYNTYRYCNYHPSNQQLHRTARFNHQTYSSKTQLQTHRLSKPKGINLCMKEHTLKNRKSLNKVIAYNHHRSQSSNCYKQPDKLKKQILNENYTSKQTNLKNKLERIKILQPPMIKQQRQPKTLRYEPKGDSQQPEDDTYEEISKNQHQIIPQESNLSSYCNGLSIVQKAPKQRVFENDSQLTMKQYEHTNREALKPLYINQISTSYKTQSKTSNDFSQRLSNFEHLENQHRPGFAQKPPNKHLLLDATNSQSKQMIEDSQDKSKLKDSNFNANGTQIKKPCFILTPSQRRQLIQRDTIISKSCQDSQEDQLSMRIEESVLIQPLMLQRFKEVRSIIDTEDCHIRLSLQCQSGILVSLKQIRQCPEQIIRFSGQILIYKQIQTSNLQMSNILELYHYLCYGGKCLMVKQAFSCLWIESGQRNVKQICQMLKQLILRLSWYGIMLEKQLAITDISYCFGKCKINNLSIFSLGASDSQQDYQYFVTHSVLQLQTKILAHWQENSLY